MADKFYDLEYNFVGQDWSTNILNDINLITGDSIYGQVILLRLLIPRGKYLLNPNLGSDLYLLKNSKATTVTQNQVQKIVIDALQPEIDAGNISGVQVETSLSGNDGVKIKVTAQVAQGNTINVNLLLNP